MPQYREYLGEYLHILKRPDEALAEWRKMAEGPQRTATNLSRLAEVLSQFGYLKESLELAVVDYSSPVDVRPPDVLFNRKTPGHSHRES